MAFLKETERSLRIYFVLVGVIGVVASLAALGDARKLLAFGSAIPLRWHIAVWVPQIIRAVLGIGLIVAGIRLRSALLTGARWIEILLFAGIANQILEVILAETLLGSVAPSGQFQNAAIVIAITAYLFHNIRRLSAEARDRAGIPPAPPEARAIERDRP